MTKITAAILALVVLGGASSWAHEKYRFVGTVVKLELKKSESADDLLFVRFKEKAKDITVQIAIFPDTLITRDKKKVATSELKAGLSVVVDAIGDDYSDLEAVEVRIVPALGK